MLKKEECCWLCEEREWYLGHYLYTDHPSFTYFDGKYDTVAVCVKCYEALEGLNLPNPKPNKDTHRQLYLNHFERIKKKCWLCEEKEPVNHYDLYTTNGERYDTVEMCEDCSHDLYEVNLPNPHPIKELHRQLYLAYLHDDGIVKPSDGECQFCHHDRAYDYLLRSNGEIYSAIDVCESCGEYLYGEKIESPEPITSQHVSILMRYINYVRMNNKKRHYCELCHGRKAHDYTLKSHGEAYHNINVCHDCGIALHGVNIECPQQDRELHIDMLRAFLHYEDIPDNHNGCEFCGGEKAYDYYLKSGDITYGKANVCLECAWLLHDQNIQSPMPILSMHKSILQAYINNFSAKMSCICGLCGNDKSYNYELKYNGHRYDIIGVCHSCGETLYGYYFDTPYPIRLVHMGLLISFMNEIKAYKATQEPMILTEKQLLELKKR